MDRRGCMTVCVCTFNRARRLPALVAALRDEAAPHGSEILVVDNNSTDDTARILAELAAAPGPPLRVVAEPRQGITYARNRAIEESRASAFLAFIDDDELPEPGWLDAALRGLVDEEADAVGGRIRVRLPGARPPWLDDELLGFLGELDHGPVPLWVRDRSTPLWSGNIAFRTAVFGDGLRFDHNYNRAGIAVGGGSDAVLFRRLLGAGARLRYRPDMVVRHFVDPWKLRRRYFVTLHFRAGEKLGAFEMRPEGRTALGVPPYLVRLAARQWARAAADLLLARPRRLRTVMNAAHATGTIRGRLRAWRTSRRRRPAASGAEAAR